MTKQTTASFVALCIIVVFIIGCGKKKDECKSASCKLLMEKSWVYDAEAARTEALTLAGKKSGIENLKDIKLKKDVKKFADYISAKKLYFGYGKDKYCHRLVCSVRTGKGIIASKRTGYWKLSDDGKKLSIDLYGKKKIEKITYKILKLEKNKLVMLKDKSIITEVYISK